MTLKMSRLKASIVSPSHQRLLLSRPRKMLQTRRQQLYDGQNNQLFGDGSDGEDSLFVGGNTGETAALLESRTEGRMHPEEEDDINKAIALSLKNQHDFEQESGNDDEFEDVPMAEPQWTQKAAESSRPIHGKQWADDRPRREQSRQRCGAETTRGKACG